MPHEFWSIYERGNFMIVFIYRFVANFSSMLIAATSRTMLSENESFRYDDLYCQWNFIHLRLIKKKIIWE